MPANTRVPTVSSPEGVVVVTMTFESDRAVDLGRLLAHYVVVSRAHRGCRNIDLCASATVDGRFLVLQKWSDVEAQKAHFDSPEMVAMAEGCRGLLRSAPSIDLFDSISAHDLA